VIAVGSEARLKVQIHTVPAASTSTANTATARIGLLPRYPPMLRTVPPSLRLTPPSGTHSKLLENVRSPGGSGSEQRSPDRDVSKVFHSAAITVTAALWRSRSGRDHTDFARRRGDPERVAPAPGRGGRRRAIRSGGPTDHALVDGPGNRRPTPRISLESTVYGLELAFTTPTRRAGAGGSQGPCPTRWRLLTHPPTQRHERTTSAHEGTRARERRTRRSKLELGAEGCGRQRREVGRGPARAGLAGAWWMSAWAGGPPETSGRRTIRTGIRRGGCAPGWWSRAARRWSDPGSGATTINWAFTDPSAAGAATGP
jgi:hypothetical protein